MEDRHNIDKIIKESFENTSFKAPKSLWENIAKEIKNPENQALDSKIKESFDNVISKAPAGLWTNISKELKPNTSIYTKIKESFNQNSAKAPSHIWEKINNQLYIDQVWVNIEKKLSKIAFWNKMKRVSLLSILFFLISLFGYKSYIKYLNINEKQVVEVTKQTKNKPQLIIENKKNTTTNNQNNTENKNNTNKTKNSSNKSKNINFKENANFSDKKNNPTNILATNRNDKNNTTIQKNGNPILKNNLLNKNLLNITEHIYIQNINPKIADLPLPGLQKEKQHKTEFNKIKTQLSDKISVGFTYSYNNTWLIDNRTKSSFDKNSLNTTMPTFTSNYGFILNYQLSSRWFILNQAYVNSSESQLSSFYSSGRYHRQKVELTYYKLATLVNYSVPLSFLSDKASFVMAGGGYVAYFKDFSSSTNGIKKQVLPQYSKNNFGAKIAIGTQLNLQTMTIGAGLNSEYGFKNLFKGTEEYPSYLNKLHNVNFGLYVNVAYKL